MSTIEIILTILGSLGGVEFVKWLFTRKSHSRHTAAKAQAAETAAETDEFHLLRERLELSDKQLLEKEQRFHEQTQLVRDRNSQIFDLQKQLIDKAVEIGELQSRISALEVERKMKLCERRGCQQRQPQSGY